MIELENLENVVPVEVMSALSKAALSEVLTNIAEAARAEWMKAAGRALHTTRRDYIFGIQPVKYKPGMAVISLVGQMPNILEHGQARYDMHDTLLGPKVPTTPVGKPGKHEKTDGSGYYRAIPFKHSATGGAGTASPKTGSAYEGHQAVSDAAKLGADVYGAAKKLGATKSAPYGGTKWGEKLPEGLAPKLKREHATDIYAGMVRLEKTYKKATQSTYMTFRTIATGSPGWIRKDTRPGVQLHRDVQSFVKDLAPQAFAAYVEGLG